MLKYDCLRDSATTLLPTKLHGSDKRCHHSGQQMINFDNCRYENFGIKLCFNFNVVVFSDDEKTKWKTIIMPMYNYTCTLCKISTIVHCYDLHLREYQLIYCTKSVGFEKSFRNFPNLIVLRLLSELILYTIYFYINYHI